MSITKSSSKTLSVIFNMINPQIFITVKSILMRYCRC